MQARIRRLSRAITEILKGDRKRRAGIAGEEVETLLGVDPPKKKEAWRRLKVWYKSAVNRAPPPARATLERIMADQVNLYIYVPSPGENIPVTVNLVKVDDLVSMEDEIEEAVKKLRRNRSGGPSGIQAEHLKGWLAVPKREKRAAEKGEEKNEGEEGEPHWENLVELIQPPTDPTREDGIFAALLRVVPKSHAR